MRFLRSFPSSLPALVAAAMNATSCGRAPEPVAVPNPARGLRTLTTADADVTDIAVAAARSLPPGGTVRSLFAGVFVDGRKSRAASEAVARATGFVAVAESGRGVRAECRKVNMSTGASTPIPCPASVAASMPPTYTFVSVRATADSAYVGSTMRAARAPEESCIVLTRAGASWNVLRTIPTSATACGR